MSVTENMQRWIANWSRRRHGADHEPVAITNRRIYILPTRLGLMYAATVVTMGIGGMNYGNNLALMLAFLLAALGFVAMHHTHRNLAGLLIRTQANEPVFAGQLLQIQLTIHNPSPQLRLALQAETRLDGELLQAQPIHVDTGAQGLAQVPVISQRRGWLSIERMTVCTRYPFGLFRGWTVLHLPLKCLVYPKPSERSSTPPPSELDTRSTQDLHRGDDEFAGLRVFHPGDSPKRIAWKAYAREQGLLTKQYAGAAVSTCMLDWDSLAGLDVEARLSRLCRWVIDSHQQGIAYGLRLPGFNAEPALTEAHRARCLNALALFQGGA
jgi:uncharacterized protein (DUF58 family)